MRGMQNAGARTGDGTGSLELEAGHRFYCRIDAVRRLLFFCATLAWAQQNVIPTPAFPDQTQDPKLAGGAEMLEAVCPGHVITTTSLSPCRGANCKCLTLPEPRW